MRRELMTTLQYITVFGLAIGSWLGMCQTMRQMKPRPLAIFVIVLCLAGMIGAFALGAHWQNLDFTCKPGTHCFPWGD